MVQACVRDDVRAGFSASEMVCEGAGDGLCARRRWFLTRRKCFLTQRRSVRRVFRRAFFLCSLPLGGRGVGRCFSKSKSDCLWGGCMLCFKLSKLPPLWEGGGRGLPQIHRKGSARRMQSRARSSYAEPQPSLAMYLKYTAKVRRFPCTSKYRLS